MDLNERINFDYVLLTHMFYFLLVTNIFGLLYYLFSPDKLDVLEDLRHIFKYKEIPDDCCCFLLVQWKYYCQDRKIKRAEQEKENLALKLSNNLLKRIDTVEKNSKSNPTINKPPSILKIRDPTTSVRSNLSDIEFKSTGSKNSVKFEGTRVGSKHDHKNRDSQEHGPDIFQEPEDEAILNSMNSLTVPDRFDRKTQNMRRPSLKQKISNFSKTSLGILEACRSSLTKSNGSQPEIVMVDEIGRASSRRRMSGARISLTARNSICSGAHELEPFRQLTHQFSIQVPPRRLNASPRKNRKGKMRAKPIRPINLNLVKDRLEKLSDRDCRRSSKNILKNSFRKVNISFNLDNLEMRSQINSSI